MLWPVPSVLIPVKAAVGILGVSYGVARRMAKAGELGPLYDVGTGHRRLLRVEKRTVEILGRVFAATPAAAHAAARRAA